MSITKVTQSVLDVVEPMENQTAVIIPESQLRVSYRLLREQILSMSDTLVSAGIRCGDRVAIVMPNGLPLIISMFAASVAGTAAPLNPASPYQEFLVLLKCLKARVLLCLLHQGDSARRAAADLGIPVFAAEAFNDGTLRVCDASKISISSPSVDDNIALVLHTSGSTGQPRCIPLRHSNLTVSAANIAKAYSLTQNDSSLCVMPLFHIHGIVASIMATLVSGGTVVVPSGFNALTAWRLVREYKITWYSAVPTIHNMLLSRLRGRNNPDSLRFIRSCSAPFAAESIQKMEGMLGVPVVG